MISGDWSDFGLLPDAKRTVNHWKPKSSPPMLARSPVFLRAGTQKPSKTRDGIRAALAEHDKLSINDIARMKNLTFDRVRAMIQTMGDEVCECGTKVSENSRVVKLFGRVK